MERKVTAPSRKIIIKQFWSCSIPMQSSSGRPCLACAPLAGLDPQSPAVAAALPPSWGPPGGGGDAGHPGLLAERPGPPSAGSCAPGCGAWGPDLGGGWGGPAQGSPREDGWGAQGACGAHTRAARTASGQAGPRGTRTLRRPLGSLQSPSGSARGNQSRGCGRPGRVTTPGGGGGAAPTGPPRSPSSWRGRRGCRTRVPSRSAQPGAQASGGNGKSGPHPVSSARGGPGAATRRHSSGLRPHCPPPGLQVASGTRLSPGCSPGVGRAVLPEAAGQDLCLSFPAPGPPRPRPPCAQPARSHLGLPLVTPLPSDPTASP